MQELIKLVVENWWLLVPGLILTGLDLYQRVRRAHAEHGPMRLVAGLSLTLIPALILAFLEMQSQRDEARTQLAVERNVPAKKRVAELENQVAAFRNPRRLTHEAFLAIYESLRSVPRPPNVWILGVNRSLESEGLKESIANLFHELGSTIKRSDDIMGAPIGIEIQATADNPAGRAFSEGMTKNGLPTTLTIRSPEEIMDCCWGEAATPNDVTIVVGLPDPIASLPSVAE